MTGRVKVGHMIQYWQLPSSFSHDKHRPMILTKGIVLGRAAGIFQFVSVAFLPT